MIFESLEKLASESRVSETRAVIAGQERAKTQFEKYIGNATNDEDRQVRLAHIEGELRVIATEVCQEYDYDDSEKVYLASTVALGGGHKSDCGCGFCENKGKLPGSKKDEDTEDKTDEPEEKDEEKEDENPWDKESSRSISSANEIYSSIWHLACACCEDCGDCKCEKCANKKEASLVTSADENISGDSYQHERLDLKADTTGNGLEDIGSPKIDKDKAGDVAGTFQEPIDVDSQKHQLENQRVTDRADYNNPDFDPENPVRERIDADTALQPEFTNGPNTETWTGTDFQANPVTSSVSKWFVLE